MYNKGRHLASRLILVMGEKISVKIPEKIPEKKIELKRYKESGEEFRVPSNILQKIENLNKSEHFPGLYYRVFKLKETGKKSIAVKRLKTERFENKKNPIGEARKLLKRFKEQDAMVREYFGSRFVPPARFVETDSLRPEEGFSLKGKEFLTIQGWVSGVEPDKYLEELRNKPIPTKLKSNLTEFIRKYRKMQEREKNHRRTDIYKFRDIRC